MDRLEMGVLVRHRSIECQMQIYFKLVAWCAHASRHVSHHIHLNCIFFTFFCIEFHWATREMACRFCRLSIIINFPVAFAGSSFSISLREERLSTPVKDIIDNQNWQLNIPWNGEGESTREKEREDMIELTTKCHKSPFQNGHWQRWPPLEHSTPRPVWNHSNIVIFRMNSDVTRVQ